MSLARAFSSTAVSLQRTIPAWQNTVMSTRAANTLNPIRAIVDHLKVSQKSFRISLFLTSLSVYFEF